MGLRSTSIGKRVHDPAGREGDIDLPQPARGETDIVAQTCRVPLDAKQGPALAVRIDHGQDEQHDAGPTDPLAQ